MSKQKLCIQFSYFAQIKRKIKNNIEFYNKTKQIIGLLWFMFYFSNSG